MKQIITARRVLRGEQLEPLDNGAIVIDEGAIVKVLPVRAVSYTHLTLPTILLV